MANGSWTPVSPSKTAAPVTTTLWRVKKVHMGDALTYKASDTVFRIVKKLTALRDHLVDNATTRS